MTRPPFLCTCGATIPHGVTCACKLPAIRARKARHDVHRPSARERGYDRAWQLRRNIFLAYEPICQRPGCSAPSTVVDHITPHRGDRALFNDPDNLQALCKACHDGWKQQQEREA